MVVRVLPPSVDQLVIRDSTGMKMVEMMVRQL